jgi:hypothetical protein
VSLLPVALLLPAAIATSAPTAAPTQQVLVQATVVRADDPAMLDALVACSGDARAFARAVALAEGDGAVQALQRPTVLTWADERAKVVTSQGESRRVALEVVPQLDDGALVLDLEAEVITPVGGGTTAISAIRSRLTAREGQLAILRAGPLLVATTAWTVEGPEEASARLRGAAVDRDALPTRARARRRALHAACPGD